MTTEGGESGSAPHRGRLSRRVLLLGFTGIAAVAGAASLLRWLDLRELEDRVRQKPWLRRWLALDLDPRSGVGTLKDHELTALVALGEVLMPSRFIGRSDAQAITRETARELAADVPGQRLELTRGVELLDRRSDSRHGRPFAALSIEERGALVEEILAPMVRSGAIRQALDYVLGNGREVWRFYRFVARALMVGFYSSELGWSLVGYPLRPGACPGLADYQSPPAPLAES